MVEAGRRPWTPQWPNSEHVNPRAPRSGDLARRAQVEGVVQRSICGHLTEKMTELYSSVGQDEVRAAMERVVSLPGYRSILAQGSEGAPADEGCEKGCESDLRDEGPSELPLQVAVRPSFS